MDRARVPAARSSIPSRPDVPAAEFAGEPRAEFRVHDAPRKEELLRRLEEAGVLQKEGPLLRELDFEALIDGHLRIVRFHLAEIRIQRDVERQRIVQHRLHVHPDPQVTSCCGKPGTPARRHVEKVRSGERGVGNQLQIPSRRNALQPLASLPICWLKPSTFSVTYGQKTFSLVVGNDAHQRDSPGLRTAAARSAGCGTGTVIIAANPSARQPAFGIPERVEAEIVVLRLPTRWHRPGCRTD